ncbi:hypothetical protein AXG93_4360s1270 [Marchantia polymorpha subsp. ruderalis]|uniref:Uncharacterized protein n=1 Tax=Marchantia polymorpha subsp. ruderalis TaxID=1480154 RepID=A0A176W2M1_MARPO|nr:hypothetical protein AXG93_4360s1270 [Marchantia polymorpha subsp. ruderalis]
MFGTSSAIRTHSNPNLRSDRADASRTCGAERSRHELPGGDEARARVRRASGGDKLDPRLLHLGRVRAARPGSRAKGPDWIECIAARHFDEARCDRIEWAASSIVTSCQNVTPSPSPAPFLAPRQPYATTRSVQKIDATRPAGYGPKRRYMSAFLRWASPAPAPASVSWSPNSGRDIDPADQLKLELGPGLVFHVGSECTYTCGSTVHNVHGVRRPVGFTWKATTVPNCGMGSSYRGFV